MTLEELIQKNQGQSLPVTDNSSKKELKNLNKSIQDLVSSLKKDKESDSSTTTNRSMRDIIEKTISRTNNSVKPMGSRLLSTQSKISKKDDSQSPVTVKLVETISKTNQSLLDQIKKMRLDITNLKDSIIKPQQRPKMVASGIDPNDTKDLQQRKRLLGAEDLGGGGGGGSLLGGLLGGGLAAAAAYFGLSDEEKKKLKEGVRGALDKLINGPVGQMIADAVTQTKKAAEEAINSWMEENGEQIMSDPIGWIKDKPAVAAAIGLSALAIGGALKAGVGIAKVPFKVAGAGIKMTASALGGAVVGGTAVGKMIKERIDARKQRLGEQMKKPLPGAEMDADGKPTRIEPTIDRKEEARLKAEQDAKKKIVPPMETEEQRIAREKATKKAKTDARQMGEDDTAQRKRKVGMDDIETKKKPSLMSRLKVGGKRLAKGAAKFIPGLGLGLMAYDAATAATSAEDVLDIQGREATFGEKVAAGVGGLTEGLTMGLVNREDVAKKLAGKTEENKQSRDKVADAINKKAKDFKTEKEISKQISMRRIQLEKMSDGGMISKENLPEARQIAGEIADLKAQLRNVRAAETQEMQYQPAKVLKERSAENKSLSLPSPNMAASPYQGMMQNINNVFNSSNQTLLSAGTSTPRNTDSSIARYLDRLFTAN
jgi:hypothetical protein